FAIAKAEQLARIKLVGYVEAVSAALPRLKPSSSIVLFSGVAKTNPYAGSTMISVVNGRRWHDQDHGDGARADPGQLHLTRPRARLADLEARPAPEAQPAPPSTD